MKFKKLGAAILATGIIALSATPANALEHGELAPDTPESRTVASLKIGRVGNFGDCTGTLVSDQWVLTARHCLESVNNKGTQVRLGQEVYDVDSWALSPHSDAGLLHLTRKVTSIQPATLAQEEPQVGQVGTLYGWSSSSSMARRGQLPMAKMEVKERLGGAPTGGPTAPTAPTAPAAPTDGESITAPAMPSVDGENAVIPPAAAGGESVAVPGTPAVSADGENVPADAAMMSMASTILDAHSLSGAGMQGGDSGGPFFVNGKLAGLATAGTANGDPDLPSPSAAITTLAGTVDWVNDVTSGRDTKSVLTAENTPLPPKTEQTSSENMWVYLAIALSGIVLTAAYSYGIAARKWSR